jgi:hypothetical protein
MKTPELIKLLDAVTATTTSERVNIENAEKISLFLTRANHSAGSSAFAVEVSIDGDNWVTFSKLISNVTNTNVQNKTRVASVSLASNTTSTVDMDLENSIYRWMRLTVTETTDGTHTAKALIQRNF